jgi:hypothetical protein
MTALVHGRDWFQHRPPPELAELPDEAVDGAGTVFRGARARVYHLLRIVAEKRLRLPIGQVYGPPGAVPRHFLVEAWSGGASGDRRVRELGTRHGFHVEHEAFEPPAGTASSTMLYRLSLGGEGVPAPDPHPHPHGELSTLTFYTAVGRSPQVDHYGSARHLTDSLYSFGCGGLEARDRVDAYRQRLLDAYRVGHLVEQLHLAPKVVFYLHPEELASLGWDPLPMLRRALTSPALGAIDLGHLDLREEERA